jgi:hypothetical protein
VKDLAEPRPTEVRFRDRESRIGERRQRSSSPLVIDVGQDVIDGPSGDAIFDGVGDLADAAPVQEMRDAERKAGSDLVV